MERRVLAGRGIDAALPRHLSAATRDDAVCRKQRGKAVGDGKERAIRARGQDLDTPADERPLARGQVGGETRAMLVTQIGRDDQVGQRLGHRPDDVEEEPASGSGGVDALLEHDQRSTPRSASSAATSVRWRTERTIRDSRVMTSSSLARR